MLKRRGALCIGRADSRQNLMIGSSGSRPARRPAGAPCSAPSRALVRTTTRSGTSRTRKRWPRLSLGCPAAAPPTQARLRRAVSTGYYAMFHTLAESAADLFIGTERSPAWHRAYRALEHGRAKSACRQGQVMREFPADVRYFAKVFVELQVERQQADYALDAPEYEKSDVLARIGSTEQIISRLEQADVAARRGFAAHVLFEQRSP